MVGTFTQVQDRGLSTLRGLVRPTKLRVHALHTTTNTSTLCRVQGGVVRAPSGSQGYVL